MVLVGRQSWISLSHFFVIFMVEAIFLELNFIYILHSIIACLLFDAMHKLLMFFISFLSVITKQTIDEEQWNSYLEIIPKNLWIYHDSNSLQATSGPDYARLLFVAKINIEE